MAKLSNDVISKRYHLKATIYFVYVSFTFDDKSSYFSDKILDGKGDEDECASKQPKEGNDKKDETSGNKTCEEDNLVVTRKPSGNSLLKRSSKYPFNLRGLAGSYF